MADSMPTYPLPHALSSPFAPLLAPPSPSLTDPVLDDEVDSLPSTSDSDEYGDDEQEEARAGRDGDGDGDEGDGDREWRESLQQLELLLTLVVAPYVGKYFGRRCAYWGEFFFLLFFFVVVVPPPSILLPLLLSARGAVCVVVCARHHIRIYTAVCACGIRVVLMLVCGIGWARFMEWKYPNINVVITSPRTFRAAGLLEAASPL
ncbi:hypothetical protein BJ546DRAFT_982840 [Cryomyces antarcticus]